MNTRSGWFLRATAALVLCVSLVPMSPVAAQDAAAQDENYERPGGAPFFLLTDTSYGSGEQAQVRLEVAAQDLGTVDQAEGVDIALYRVKDPLAFLKHQKNLHRIDLAAKPREQDLGNANAFLWDSAVKKARKIWQAIFASDLRKQVTTQAPTLRTHPDMKKPPEYQYGPAYQAPAGMQTAARFRYPLQFAKPIAPPKDLALAGSSSNFVAPSAGNVMVPLGRQAPGLYVVEAALGRHRALALLFVSDTVAVSKTSARQMLVWVAQRAGGKAEPDAQVVWSDLVGALGTARTNAHGVATFERRVPQTSYVFGEDRAGGVFVSENFYFDSEIYNNKLYVTTDRPLYRPGDDVNIKLYGREFQSATRSRPMAAGKLEVSVWDAQGSLVQQATVPYAPDAGGQHRLTLPDNATAGGYEIRVKRGDDEYSAAFRVAQYVKPHFEILVEPAKPAFKTGEPVQGRIRLAYADGKPVAKASLSLTARAQVLTMVDGDLAYGGAFPLQIDKNQELTTDAKGIAAFTLPAAKEPSRLVLSVLASDGAAQRVRATKELLVERSASAYTFRPERQFAEPREPVTWRLAALDAGAATRPVRWVAIHLESQTRTQGNVAANDASVSLALERPGTYNVQLQDAQEQILGAGSFWVSGGELKPPQGAIEVVFDKPKYRAGDTARALITFPEVVDDALLTLERDSVEAYGRLSAPDAVGRVRALNERQWELSLTVQARHAPNITFSVAYVKGRDFGFQNAGIAVEQRAVDVRLSTDKRSYQPGETVTLDIQTESAGKPVAASLSLGAVDEMVYVLQPEMAPSILDFFYHARRNNVRTHSSLAFIGYDEATVPQSVLPRSRSVQERGIKLMERPRRDERDTAYWNANVRTDARGHARVQFVVPDALTRWRITARAAGLGAADGLVGERRSYFQSDKPFYAKWTSPNWQRSGDKAMVSLAVFNQTRSSAVVDVRLQSGGGAVQTQSLTLNPGANFASFTLAPQSESASVRATVLQGGKTLDALESRLDVVPPGWANVRQTSISLAAGQDRAALILPADAMQITVQAVNASAAQWSTVADALIDYPYGCVEQTASRLIPLALALRSLPTAAQDPLRQRLFSARLRLASMAGPNAVFGWWGQGTQDSLLLSSYAYYADYMATQTLGLTLPAEHWERLVDIYAKQHAQEPLAYRALALWTMRELGLPTATYTRGLLDALQADATKPAAPSTGASWVLGGSEIAGAQQAVAVLLANQLAKADGIAWPAALEPAWEQTQRVLSESPQLFAQAARVMAGLVKPDAPVVLQALQRASTSDATIDRALALAWLAKGTGLTGAPSTARLSIIATGGAGAAAGAATATAAGTWQAQTTITGGTQWRWSGATLPRELAVQAADQPRTVAVRFTSRAEENAGLPAVVERKLYRLERTGDAFRPVPVKAGEALSPTALYLDEVTVAATANSKPLRYALLEVPLPPGASMEPSTWGIRLAVDAGVSAASSPSPAPAASASASSNAVPLERAQGQITREGYTVAVDELRGSKTLRHLVRFGQKGDFVLPRARLWRMYQPEGKAMEAGPVLRHWVVE